MPAKLTGSVALTLYSWLVMMRVTIAAPTTPQTMPSPASRAPWLTMSVNTFRRLAPSAMRTPISCVRCDTAYDEHAVDADRREQQRDHAEDREHPAEQAELPEGADPRFLAGLDAEDRQRGIGLPDLLRAPRR